MTSIYTDRENLRWRGDDPLIGIVYQHGGEAVFYHITVEGANAPSSPGATVYKNGIDVTATVMGGDVPFQVIGQVIILSPLYFSSNQPESYSVVVVATLAGVVQKRQLIVQCPGLFSRLIEASNYLDRRNIIWKLDKPRMGIVFQFPSETVTYRITVEGSVLPYTPSASVYKDGGNVDISGQVMPGGVHSTSGQVIILKPLTALVAGSVYSILVMMKPASQLDIRGNELIVQCVDPKAT